MDRIDPDHQRMLSYKRARTKRQRRLFVILLIIFAVALARFVHLTFP